MGELFEFCFHLVDLCLLARDDAPTQLFDLLILYRGFLAHEDRTSVMRDHRPQELTIIDRGLFSNPKPRPHQ